MPRTPINPGRVDWTGENPGMYLREVEGGPYTCLASFFRVVYSPQGPGHALFLLWDPQASHPNNACYTDNEKLATWLRDDFVAHFGSFRDNALLGQLPIKAAVRFSRAGDSRREYSEVVAGPGVEIRLTWRGMSDPYLVELTADKSATGVHEMFSLFLDAREAELVVNGERARGRPFSRDFQGRRGTSAFLAFSETWVRV